MEHFSKKYRHSKSKIIHKFHYLLFVFLLVFLTPFFPISPNHTCQKILNIFVCFIIRIIDFIREFRKILEFWLRKIEIL